jgi:hypothetical protein
MENTMKVEQLPETDSIQELARFWDTHDLTDFEAHLEEVSEPVFERPSQQPAEVSADTFTEGFEIVISTIDEDKYDWEKEEYRPQYLEAITNTMVDLGVSREEVTFERTGVGVGAEGDAIALIIFAGITVLAAGKKLFLAGKTINENIEAWMELAKKLRRFLTKLKADYVSQPFAAALALEEIIKSNPKALRFDLAASLIHVVPNPSMDMTGLSKEFGQPIQEVFRRQPMRYYTFVFRAFDDSQTEGYWANVPAAVHLICVRSTGKIEFHHFLPVRNWLRFEGIEEEKPGA